jgi:Kef-type K+ transport system membrane component KefB
MFGNGMNLKGSGGLIVLNIAYNVGAFTPTLFTMLVVMALVTTMITTPILDLLGVKNAERTTQDVEAAA